MKQKSASLALCEYRSDIVYLLKRARNNKLKTPKKSCLVFVIARLIQKEINCLNCIGAQITLFSISFYLFRSFAIFGFIVKVIKKNY